MINIAFSTHEFHLQAPLEICDF